MLAPPLLALTSLGLAVPWPESTGTLPVLASTSSAAVAVWIDAAIEGRDVLPPLARVQDAAVAALDLVPKEEARSWARRARRRGWVPTIDLRFGTDAELGFRDALSDRVSQTRTEGRGLRAQIGARFQLGELVFSQVELRSSRERLARAAAEQAARDRATEIYFDRLELLVIERLDPSAEVAVRAARLDGLLRAVTGGLLDGPSRGGRAGAARERERE